MFNQKGQKFGEPFEMIVEGWFEGFDKIEERLKMGFL